MKELAAMYESAGAADVKTFINSGNVIFSAPAAKVPAIEKKVRAAIAKKFGFDAPMVFRTGAELAKVVRAVPFAKSDLDHAHVTFFADAPKKKDLALLEPKRHESERLVLKGRELYLHLPKGVGQTKLIASFVDKTLGTFGTTRNLRTVTKLAELASE
jgi:uncharacterized protein (DUF1697 family)